MGPWAVSIMWKLRMASKNSSRGTGGVDAAVARAGASFPPGSSSRRHLMKPKRKMPRCQFSPSHTSWPSTPLQRPSVCSQIALAAFKFARLTSSDEEAVPFFLSFFFCLFMDFSNILSTSGPSGSSPPLTDRGFGSSLPFANNSPSAAVRSAATCIRCIAAENAAASMKPSFLMTSCTGKDTSSKPRIISWKVAWHSVNDSDNVELAPVSAAATFSKRLAADLSFRAPPSASLRRSCSFGTCVKSCAQV
mmetsp:Transcript_77242/g.139382  ORF Transcript_77242/g.139382 Transcript_77242/m.139382 type:complete len:249 (-) Transcript_77242:245-991(-)